MNIIKYRNILIIIGVAITIGAALIIGVFGLRQGIDFTGGSLTEVSYEVRPDKSALEVIIGNLDLGGFSIRETNDEIGRDGYILRSRDLSESERMEVENIMLTLGEGGELVRFTSIGPVIGEELKDKAGWAIGGVILIIVLYVAFAFLGVGKPVGSWVYGSITIFVLVHDVLVPTAIMSLLGYLYGMEVDVLFVTALLAILGYSVNDTIVIFDRVRENLIKYRTEKRKTVNLPGGVKREEVDYTLNKPFDEIVGLSVSEALLRSFNTSFTTLLALFALYYFGGLATSVFALMLIAGVVAGTYSSIFLASPLLVWYAEKFVKADSN